MKMKWRLENIAIIAVLLIAACAKDEFVEFKGLCPVVIETNPVNTATDVSLNQVITVTFNEKMNPSTITNASLIIKAVNPINGTITYSGNTATFTPSVNLLPNTLYTGRVTTAVKDSTGNALQVDYVWTFTTGVNLAPFVITTDPENSATNVNLNKIVTATFSVPMDPLSINASSFIISDGTASIIGTVTYNGTMATFVPLGALIPNTQYKATITIQAKNSVGTAMSNDYVWTFNTITIAAPTVISTDPANNTTNVSLGKIITATFSEPMNASSINTSSFILNQETTRITGTVTYTGTTASFTPTSPLLSNTTYTGRITTSAKNLAGVTMEYDYVWTFSTGTTLTPTVIATSPVTNATNVVLNKIVTATFSMAMNPLTINSSSFTLKQGNTIITGVVTYSGTTASFTPSVALQTNTVYTATISTGAKNLAGTSLANDYAWSFTTALPIAPTVIATDPTNNATNVPVGKIISATFSMAMNPTTITTASFIVKQGATVIPGTVSYSGITATFIPTNPLASNNIYTATITTAVKNAAGTPLSNDYVWAFTTLSLIPPTVISTDPSNNATGVALNKIVTANFSVPMDPTTINSTTFLIKEGSNLIAGTVAYNGTTASFTSGSPLKSNTIYTGTITTGVKNVAGTSMVSNYLWTFTTLTQIPPIVISTDPLNNATGVALNKTITADFNIPMDPLTINSSSFNLKQGNTIIPANVTYTGLTASLNPDNQLLSNTTYTATITTAVKSIDGIPLANIFVWSFTTKVSLSAPFVDLKSVARFGIIAGVGVSNNAGFSQIHDLDVGISPGVRSSVTGFPPAIVVNGAIYASDDLTPPGTAAMLTQAKADLTAAYNFAKGATVPAPNIVSGDIGGLTLAPGIYKTTSTLLIQSGDLTLDAQGDPSAIWIFQIGSGFTTIGGAGGSVILSGGAQAANVFWQTGSSATIGDGTSFEGNVLALTSITMNSAATARGRMLAINGAVVMTSTNFIYKP